VIGAGSTALSARAPAVDDDGTSPVDGAVVSNAAPPTLRWRPIAQAAVTRLEIEAGDGLVFEALLGAGATEYALPPFVLAKAIKGELRWRIVGTDAAGRGTPRTSWRRLVVR
jgi:hypothetical protein